jgi:hypothetical protein
MTPDKLSFAQAQAKVQLQSQEVAADLPLRRDVARNKQGQLAASFDTL